MTFSKRGIVIVGALIALGAAFTFLLYNRVRGRTISSGYVEFSSAATAAFPELASAVTQANVRTLDGKLLQLSSHAGKVVVVDLWATWCAPCRKEIPHLVQLSKDYKDKGVEVIGLTTEDPATAADKVRDFAKEFQIDYTLGWASGVASGLTQGNTNIPQTFVITRDGRLFKRMIGFNALTGPAELRSAVDNALTLGTNARPATDNKSVSSTAAADGVKRITPQELHDLIGRHAAVAVDVRGEPQYVGGHIRGTLWIPEGDLNNRINELPQGKLIVTYCS
jgi:thiol-disulfide isomerase/thioredoxin